MTQPFRVGPETIEIYDSRNGTTLLELCGDAELRKLTARKFLAMAELATRHLEEFGEILKETE
jgi:hypothetical protein